MTRDQLIAANPIVDFVRSKGHELRQAGENFVTSGCPVTQHKPGHRPVIVYPRTQSWSCHDCKRGGSVIDWVMREKNVTAAEAMQILAGGFNGAKPTATLVKTYDYRDETGKLLYQTCRYAPKDFKQRRPDGKGGWIWNLYGVRRVLYRLPDLISDVKRGLPVIIPDGEKDVDALVQAGIPAAITCNPMGGGNWRDEYSEVLRGATVFLIADREPKGREHAEERARSLHGKASRIAVIELPDRNSRKVKDSSNWLDAGGTVAELAELLDAAPEWTPRDGALHLNKGDEAPRAESVENVEPDSTNSTFPRRVRLVMPKLYYPVNSVIGRFVHYCTQQIETPKHFIVAGALTLVSLLINRRVWYQWGAKRIFPNLFQVCVGNSGVIRKSDAIMIVREFLYELLPDVLLSDFTSHERFVESFAEQPIRGMVYSEGKALLDLFNSNYGAALAGDLIRLYDCEPISTDFKANKHKTEEGETKSRVIAKDPFLTVLVAIIPEGWRMPQGNQVNGLMGRFELLYATEREHDILTEPPVLVEEHDALLDELRRVMSLRGQMQFSSGARKQWEQIQQENRKRLNENPPNQVASNLSRMPFTILRVAMLYEIASTAELEISSESLELAHQYVNFCHDCYRFFCGEMQKTNFARLQERIVDVLEKNTGHCTYSYLFNRVSTHAECYAKTFRDALDSLEDRSRIRRAKNPTTKFPDVILLST